MTNGRQRLLRTVLLWLCVATALIIISAYVDVIGFGGPPWFGQAGASLKSSGRPYEEVVTSIDAETAADRAGLRTGDLIDVRANSAVERWQWFNGFPTPMVGRTTAFAVTRGAQHLRIHITPLPWNLLQYWYFWAGPAGMFFVVLMAGLIVWRAAPTRSNVTLAVALLLLAAGAIGWTNDFALPWVWAYVALAMLAHLVPLSAAFCVLHASTFGAPLSRARRAIALLFFATLAVIVACDTAQALAFTTLWLDPLSWWMGPLIAPWAIAIALAIASSYLAIRSTQGSERLRATWCRLSRRGIRFALDRAFSTAGFIPAATSRPRSDGTTRPLRRAAIGKRATHLAGVRVPIAHGLRATNITLARTGGAELEHIADDVGHADLRTTRKYLDRGRRRENNSALRVPLDFAATGVRGEEA
jgi:hypothetical protein